MTAVEAMDISDQNFQDFSEESLRNWTFEAGKSGQCFVDFVYTGDSQTHLVILNKDHAAAVASARAKDRASERNKRKEAACKTYAYSRTRRRGRIKGARKLP